MRLTPALILAACLLLVGCKKDDTSNASSSPNTVGGPEISGSTTPPADATGSATDTAALATPSGSVAIENGEAKLEPSTSQIQFIGTHEPPRAPEPRLGQFEKFAGMIEIGADNKLTSITIEIDTDSLVTQKGAQLTTHLKSSDFLDVREYPKATFQSTKIQEAGNSSTPASFVAYAVTGDLTLHGVTKEISFPANAKVENGELQLTSSFTINRMDFDITFKGVVNDITVNVLVGTPTGPLPPEPVAAGGGGGGRGGAGGRGNFDPEQFFASSDKDSDGKLSGDEIPQPMREDLANVDKDQDGVVSKEEFQARMRERFARGGQGGPSQGAAPSAADARGTSDQPTAESTESDSTEGDSASPADSEGEASSGETEPSDSAPDSN